MPEINQKTLEQLRSKLTKIAEAVDKNRYGKRKVERNEEYIELSLQALTREKTSEYEYCWLGTREKYLQDIRLKIEKENEESPRSPGYTLRRYNDLLNNYQLLLDQYCGRKIEFYNKIEALYHGSSDETIKVFTPRIESAGDKIPLVYATADKEFALTFALEKRAIDPLTNKEIKENTESFSHLTSKISNDKRSAYYTCTLEQLIMEHDQGAALYTFSRDNFGIEMAKDTYEAVSQEAVTPQERITIASNLNHLVVSALENMGTNKEYIVTYNDENGNEKKLTAMDLYKTRKRCIEKCKESPNKFLLQNLYLIKRLEFQQSELATLIKRKTGKNFDEFKKFIDNEEKSEKVKLPFPSYTMKIEMERETLSHSPSYESERSW